MSHFNLKQMLQDIKYEPQLDLLVQMAKDERSGDYVDRRRFNIKGEWYILVDSSIAKVVVGRKYNYIFSKKNGSFHRWGESIDHAPLYSLVGPEILDIEIIYNNTPMLITNDKLSYQIQMMSLDTFKLILNKIPRTVTRVVFATDESKLNSDFIGMLEYCQEIGIVPVLPFDVSDSNVNSLAFTDDQIKNMIDDIDLYSSCVDVYGRYCCYPSIKHCSMMGNHPDQEYLDIIQCDDFLSDIWYSSRMNQSRNERLNIPYH